MKKILIVLLSALFLVACGNAEEYGEELQSTADELLDNAAEVEEMLNQYSNVWSYSIKSRGAIPVSDMATQTGLEEDVITEYFQVNQIGNIPDDFTLNILSLNLYFESTGRLEEIEQSSAEMKNKINELNDPPSGYEKAYDELLDLFTYTEEYIEMALNPSGSLQSFDGAKGELSSDILSKHKRVEATMPN